MTKLLDRFISFVFEHPEGDILILYQIFLNALTEQDAKLLFGMSALFIESAKSARAAPPEMQKIICKDL